MANSPFNIIKTHLWSEVKEYTWGNLTIGQNYKTVLGNVQSSQTTKKNNKKTFASTLLTGIGNVRKNLIRHYITGISVGSTAIRKTTRLLGSIVNVITSTSKYIRRFISSLTSSLTVAIRKTTRLLGSIINVMPSTSKYIRSFVLSLTSSASSLATKLIVQLYTIPKTVIAGINLNSNSIRKTTRLLGSIVNVIVFTSKYIRRFVLSLTSSLTVLLYTVSKTVVAVINLNSNAIRKTQSIVSGHVSTIGRTGRNVVKTIKSITLGLSESVRLSLRTIISNVSLNSAIVRRLTKSLISYSVLNASIFIVTLKQIVTSVLNSVFFMKLITRLINVQSYVIFTLKNNIYSTVDTLVNSYVAKVSKSVKQFKTNIVSSSMKLSTVAKQLNCNIQNISAKLVFTARTVNTVVNGMSNFLRGILYRQLLVATVNIVHNRPPIKWIDNKARTWADLTTYRWCEFNDSTFAIGVLKKVFREISSSTSIVVNVKNNIKRLVTSYTNTTSLIFRFVDRIIKNVTLLTVSTTNHIERLFKATSSSLASTSKYIRSFVSSLTSLASSLVTKLIVQIRTIPKTVIAGINLNSNLLRKTQSIVNGYIGVVVGTIKNISRLVSLHITIISTRNNINNSTVGTLVSSYVAKVSKSAKQLKSNVVLSSMKLSTVAKQLKCNIQNISSKLVFTARTVNTIVMGMVNFLHTILYRQLLVATVNIVYNTPPIKWADNKVRIWADLIAYRWHEFNDSTSATGVWKKVFRKISSSTNVVINVKNNIKRLVTSYTNTTSLIFRFVDRIIKNVTLLTVSTTNYIERLLKATSSVLTSTSKYIRSFVSSLISSTSFLATKLTAEKTVVANNNLGSNLLIKVQSVVNGYIGVIETSGRNISKFVSGYRTITSTLKNNIYSTVDTLINSYAAKVSKSAKQLNCNIQNISSKLVFITRTVNTVVMGMASFLRGTLYRQLLVATVNIVYSVPPIKWVDNKVRTWADLTAYRWHEFNVSTFATGVWKNVFRKISSSTNVVINVKNNIKRLVTSYINITSLIFRFVDIIIKNVTLALASTSKYIRSFVSSLTSSASSLATKLIVQLYTIPKTVIAGINLNSNSLRKTQSIVNGYIGVAVGTIKNITRTVNTIVNGIIVLLRKISYRKLLVATVNIVYNIPFIKWADNKVRTWSDLTAYRWHEFNVSTFATGVWKNVFRKISSSTNVVINVKNNIKRLVTSYINITSLIFRFVDIIIKNVTLALTSTSKYIRSFVSSLISSASSLATKLILQIRTIPKTIVATVNTVYNVPPIKWADNKVRTWADLIVYRWHEFDGMFATGVWKRVFRTSTVSTSVTFNATDFITIFRFYFMEFIGKVGSISNKTFYATKSLSSLTTSIANALSRFGKAVVQSITTIAVHSFNILLSAVKEHSIKMSAIHKLKQEVIWRMGANARGETLHMVLGETKVIELTVVNEDGTPTDLAGADVKFAVSGTVEKDCGISGNKITVMIEPDDIKSTGTYDYEFRLKDIFNRVDSLIMGKVIVEPKVVSAY